MKERVCKSRLLATAGGERRLKFAPKRCCAVGLLLSIAALHAARHTRRSTGAAAREDDSAFKAAALSPGRALNVVANPLHGSGGAAGGGGAGGAIRESLAAHGAASPEAEAPRERWHATRTGLRLSWQSVRIVVGLWQVVIQLGDVLHVRG